MRHQVDHVLEASREVLDQDLDIHRCWTRWMGANAARITPHLWRDFEAVLYKLVTEFCQRSEEEAPPGGIKASLPIIHIR